VVARILATADGLYRRADGGIAQLPPGCRPGVNAARTLYSAIGGEVERRGLDSVSGRAVVPSARKLALLASSLTKAFLPMSRVDASPLAEARYLIDAVTATTMPRTIRRVDSRIVWLIELFDRLERREQERSGMARRERSASA